MSFNVLWSNQDYEQLAAVIAAANPDLVALQELRPEHVPALQKQLGAEYRYQVIHPVAQFHTIGLLSRFPLEQALPLADPPFERTFQVRVRVGNRPLTIIVAHLTPTNMLDRGFAQLPAVAAERYARRQAQAAALLAAVQASEQPSIILCDCNFSDTSQTYATLRAELVDSFAEAGWGFGHTMEAPGIHIPAQRLDYIWHTGELQALDAPMGAEGGSDHLPVIARLVWR